MPSTASAKLCVRRPRAYPPAFVSAALAASPSATTKGPPIPTRIPLQSLGPTERAVEVVLATSTNLLNGAIFGFLFGMISGLWSKRRIGAALIEARSNARSWGSISGVYAGLQTLSKVVRNREDRVNAVVGACGSGAAFAWGNGGGVLQGCASFAVLSYLIDVLVGDAGNNTQTSEEEKILRKR